MDAGVTLVSLSQRILSLKEEEEVKEEVKVEVEEVEAAERENK